MAGDVHADNQRRDIERARRRARRAEAAHHFFKETPEGKDLLKHLEHEAGNQFPAFGPRDDWNPYGAAFRDGMRALFLELENLIKEHDEHKRTGIDD